MHADTDITDTSQDEISPCLHLSGLLFFRRIPIILRSRRTNTPYRTLLGIFPPLHLSTLLPCLSLCIHQLRQEPRPLDLLTPVSPIAGALSISENRP